MSKIVSLTAENVKRLKAVEIKPDGNIVVIGGKNGAGKTSVLDSIEFALGGDPSAKMPIRQGEEKARVVVDLGDIVVKRVFTAAGNTSLVVTDADGNRQTSPQGILDKLVGKLTFDPLAFSREKQPQQQAILRGLVGLDFTEHDAAAAMLFDERTAVNREAKALQARLTAMPAHANAPTAEVSAADILAEQQEASDKNAANAEARSRAENLRSNAAQAVAAVTRTQNDIAAVERDIARLQNTLASHKVLLAANRVTAEHLQTELAKADDAASKLRDIDLSPFRVRAAAVEADNRKVRENAQRAEIAKQFKLKSDAAEALTRKLEAMDSEKRRKTTKAKYPVEGLSFDSAGGVTFNSIPFDQCSAAEQLRVSVAVGLALNPKLKVLLIRDGSLLDTDSMAALLEMAKAADAQIWLERVGEGDKTAIIIEDGEIKA